MVWKLADKRPSWTTPFLKEPITERPKHAIGRGGQQYSNILLCIFSFVGIIIQAFTVTRLLWLLFPTIVWALTFSYQLIWRIRKFSLFPFLSYTTLFSSQTIVILVRQQYDQDVLLLGGMSASAIIALLGFLVMINMPMRDQSWPADDISKVFTTPMTGLRSPEDNLTLWQWMSVSWVSPLLRVGNKRQLEDEDVWLLPWEYQHQHLHDAFRMLKGSVVRRLIRANWVDLFICACLETVEVFAKFAAPVLLQYLLRAMKDVHSSKRAALTYAILILLARVVDDQCGVLGLWFSRRCYERSRGEMMTMLFEKTLNRKIVALPDENSKVAASADSAIIGNNSSIVADEATPLLTAKVSKPKSSSTNLLTRCKAVFTALWKRKSEREDPKRAADMGKILNMMRYDVYEVAQRFWECQKVISKPFGLVFALALVWRLVGWASFFGVAVVLIAQVLNAIFAKILLTCERKRRRATDIRLQQTSQYIEAIRHLRWYGWHPKWLSKIFVSRQKELNLRVITFLWNTIIGFTNAFASAALPVATFYAYTALAGNRLDIEIAFPALQLFNMLQNALREIPDLIRTFLNASVAMSRIEEFMNEPNIERKYDFDETYHGNLEVKDASFAWPGMSTNVLYNVSLSFPPGLTIVAGEVASGKTALLQALLGELDKTGGELYRPAVPIGYCAQTPWLQSMTIRDNILFSSPYEDQKYKQTLDACALIPDLASFPQGDLSPIGENGIGLSGGQKARVALARAIYSSAPVLLLDDPISALDQQTAEWIVSRCLKGSLVKGRAVVLVTHRTDLVEEGFCQRIEMMHGRAITRTNLELQSMNGHLSMTTQSNSQPHRQQTTPLTDPSLELAAVPDKFEEEEHRSHGGVRMAVYWEYVKAGKLGWWSLVIASTAAYRLLGIAQSWFLKEWGEAYGQTEQVSWVYSTIHGSITTANSPLSGIFDRFPDPSINVGPWLIGFLVIVAGQSVAILLSRLMMLMVTYSAGKQMFKDLMNRVSNTTFRYYDITPIGRLMNRLTSDIGTIDGDISYQFLIVTWQAISWVSAVVVIASVTPPFLFFSIVLTLLYVKVFLHFLPTSQSLRRLEMVSLTPLMSNFGALLQGLTTVRAFRAELQFQHRVITVVDAFQKMDHFYWSVQGWLMFRFDLLSAVSTFLLTCMAIFSSVSAGLTAFVLVAADKFVSSTHQLCQQYGQLQLNFVSVERVVELLHLDQEVSDTTEPPAWWPSFGSDIILEDVSIRYAPHLELALSNVSLRLKGGSNTAVVGRTGSGKSTLAAALLATVVPESGRILIDGVDISKTNKQTLRTRITFLAQDPILFEGTLRHNLDPTEEHSDAECEAVVSRVAAANYGWTLDTAIEPGGKNLSQGQRQLVGLARAMLRRSAIIIMDEATASIDLDTAWEIQRVLREEMRGSTVITIAHRASVVRDADWAIVLEKGKLKVQGKPEDVEGQVIAGGGTIE